MKRILWLGLLVSALTLTGAMIALAQGSPTPVVAPSEAAPETTLPAPVAQPGFVDDDGDGVCDNRGEMRGHHGPHNGQSNFVDTDGDGVCDNCGRHMGQSNFLDADGDGVCDNFVDADGDGVCDNCGHRMSKGMGQGQGMGQGKGHRGGRGG